MLLLLTLLVGTLSFAQLPDLDAFSEELDLTILDSPEAEESPPAENPANHLFIGFEKMDLPPIPKDMIQSEGQTPPLHLIQLPAGTYLVSPNPARIDRAYENIATAAKHEKWVLQPPVKVVLHRDGNFSIAVGLEKQPTQQLPAGLDLSPLPQSIYAAVLADIQILQKDHPPVLQAFITVKEAAELSGLELDTREFFFFPQSPGKVWFALRVKGKNPLGKIPEQE